MTHTRFAFIKSRWHADIVDRAYQGFTELILPTLVDAIDVPGAFEMPLMAQSLAETGRYNAIACAALVVDGGIYRHDFVASAVVNALMQVGLKTGVPILSVSLTPHQFHDTQHHRSIYADHFVTKGREAAQAALSIADLHAGQRSAA
jgi:6,7-dimethyl-8-ribityllumazine synthase